MPRWFRYLTMAGEWGVPPWVLEAEIPAVWYDRWCAVKDAVAHANPKVLDVGSSVQVGNTRSQRLI